MGEEKANVPAIVDADELASGKVSEKNLVLYLSLWFNAFKEKDAGLSKDMLQKRIKQLEELVRQLTAENEALKSDKGHLEVTVTELTEKLNSLQSKHDALLMTHEETNRELALLKETYLSEKNQLESKLSELEENIATLKGNSDESVTLLQNQKDEITKERDALREELRKTREELQKEKEELQAQNAELQASLNKSKKMREELEELLKQQQEDHSKSIHALRKHLLQHGIFSVSFLTCLLANTKFMTCMSGKFFSNKIANMNQKTSTLSWKLSLLTWSSESKLKLSILLSPRRMSVSRNS